MGMYTELVIKAKVTDNLPSDVDCILNYLFNHDMKDEDFKLTTLPDHAFFESDSWELIGRCCSFYHIPTALSYYKEGYLFSRSDLKNYDNEIDKFIDWVTPYLSKDKGDCIGWKWYEEWEKPELIYIR